MTHAKTAAQSRGGANLRVRTAPHKAAPGGRLSSLLRFLPALPAAGRRRPRASSSRRGGPPAAARRAGAGLARALLVLSVLLATATAAQAQTTLVSNFGQGTDSNTQFSRDMSQPFTTGSATGGYTLSSVSIKTDSFANRTFAMSVCTVDGDGHPTSSCTALSAPSTFPGGAQTLVFTHSTGIDLDASTTYTLLITDASSTIEYVMTAANGEDSGGADGWTLADNAEFKNASDAWTDVSAGKSLRVTVTGTVKSGTTSTDATLSALALEDGDGNTVT